MSQPHYVYIVWREGRSFSGAGGTILRVFASEAVAVAFAKLLNAMETPCNCDGDPANPALVTKTLTGYSLEDLIAPPERLE